MTRPYTMRARAEQETERRERIIEAALELFREAAYDDVSLQAVAERAGVALKTVVRQFGTKEALLTASIGREASQERDRREVAPGDVAGAAQALADRYEALAEMTIRYLALEDRLPVIADGFKAVRASHLDWLAQTFAPWLTAGGAERTRRLAALFGATEIFVWWTWRARLGHSRAIAEGAMRELLEGLVARWTRVGSD